MQQIAELDVQLSKARSAIPPAARTHALSLCADILDEADNDDEQFICHAIHCLIRKHGLESEHCGPGARTASVVPDASGAFWGDGTARRADS